MSSLALRIPPVVQVALAAGLMKGLAMLLPGARLDLPGTDLAATLCGLAGAACAVAGVLSFARAGTTVDPRTPDQASRLVIRGLYHRTRNPMYLGMLLLLIGWACKLSHPAALVGPVLFVLAMNRLQIAPEEAALAERFGDDYAAYRARVRRWL